MKVVIYTTPTCPYCMIIKKMLKENNIPYTEKNVAEDDSALQELTKKTDGQITVPVIEINGKIIIGFDEPAIKKELGLS